MVPTLLRASNSITLAKGFSPWHSCFEREDDILAHSDQDDDVTSSSRILSHSALSIEAQFDCAVNDVALVDRSWAGRIIVTGNDRLDLLQRLSTNNLLSSRPGQILGTVFTTDKGRIVDYVHVLVKQNSLLLLVSRENEEKFVRWIEKYTIMEDIHLAIVTPQTKALTLFGPRAKDTAQRVFDTELATNSFVEKGLSYGVATIAYRLEFNTESVDVIVANDTLEPLVHEFESRSIPMLSDAAYQAFRISRGIPQFGTELREAFNPYEVNLTHAISFNKGCYLGQEVIARLDTYQKVQRTLCGVLLSADSALPASGALVELDGDEVGVVTSVSCDVVRNWRMCMAVLKRNSVSADNSVSIVSNEERVEGVVCNLPAPL